MTRKRNSRFVLGLPCPICNAAIFHMCRTEVGAVRAAHDGRKMAAWEKRIGPKRTFEKFCVHSIEEALGEE